LDPSIPVFNQTRGNRFFLLTREAHADGTRGLEDARRVFAKKDENLPTSGKRDEEKTEGGRKRRF
jgi:hypothetical protein